MRNSSLCFRGTGSERKRQEVPDLEKRSGTSFILLLLRLLDSELVEQPTGTSVLLDYEEHVAYIDTDCALQLWLEGDIA